ncbi:MAG: HAMP domain-containing sensor histidine kinase [Deinococcaceae bacterium]
MTLRWRLTLFYTFFLSLLLLVILVLIQMNLKTFFDRSIGADLERNYKEVLKTLNGRTKYPFLSPDGAEVVSPDIFFQISLYDEGLPYATLLKMKPAELAQGLWDIRKSYSVKQSVEGDWRLSPDQYHQLIHSKNLSASFYGKIKTTDGEKDLLILTKMISVKLLVQPNQGVIYLAKQYPSALLTQIQQTLLWVFVIAIVITSIAAYILAGRALKPLREVRRAATGITDKTLGHRVPVPNTQDEVDSLARALNRMLERIENAFETQKRFTSDASHELRTPITAIGGHAGYLLRRTQPTEQQRESLTIIKNESERLSQLVSSLLELARADGGAVPLSFAPIIATLFLEDIAMEMRPIAEGATLSVAGQDLEFRADPNRLRQVLINLVANALKAGSTHVSLQAQENGPLVHLTISDNGPGIAPQHLDRLFDRFYRVEESRSRDVGGSGLGLSIVKSIVEAHKGTIWFESELGRGTQVHLELPQSEFYVSAPIRKSRLKMGRPKTSNAQEAET